MKLFRYENYEVRVAPEALMLKPFKKLWTRDKGKTKDKGLQELSFLYFYCDPRSDYQYITDDDNRMEAVKKGLGYPDDWKPDALIKEAIIFYRTFDSSSAILLRAAMEGVEKVQKLLKDLEPDDTKSLKEYLTTLKMVPEVASMIQEAEQKLKEENEFGEAAGAIEKGMFEDGLDEVADWVDQRNKS
jgi:hypothetical protein